MSASTFRIFRLGLLMGLTLLLAACSESTQNDAVLAKLEQRVNELEAREAIRQLFTDYGRTLDNRDFAAFATLYASDSEYVGGGASGSAKGPQAIAAMLEAVITTNASGANLHVYFNEKITVAEDGQSATATSRGAFYVQNESGGPMPLIFATYRDEFVQENGRWLFKRREVIGDIPGPANEERASSAQ